MKRIIVFGGLGHFGRTATQELRALGLPVKIASRRGDTDLHVDADDTNSIHATIQPDDIVLDTAGPFHARSTALLEAAIEIGCDVIDINDNLQYAEKVLTLEPRIQSARIRVLSSASTVSAVAAAVIRQCGITSPKSATVFLAPASRYTAHGGAALSLIRSVGQPIRVFCDGRFQEFRGWSQSLRFRMPRPLGMIRGGLFETADAAYLPRIWRSLRNVTMYVDTNTLSVNVLLRLAAHRPRLQQLLEQHARWGSGFARFVGSSAGGVGYLIEGASGQVSRCAIVSRKSSFITAVAPAVLAAHAIFQDRFPHPGLVLPDRHVEPADLFAFLQSRGIHVSQLS